MHILINPIMICARVLHTSLLGDRRPSLSTPSLESPLLVTSMSPVPLHVPYSFHIGPTRHAHHACTSEPERARETVRVSSNTNYNVPHIV